MSGIKTKRKRMGMSWINRVPDIVVVDLSSLDKWKHLLNVVSEVMFNDMLDCLLITYPDGGYTDGLWYIMDRHMDMDSLDIMVLEELGIRFDELSFEMDRLIQWYLGPGFRNYKYLTKLEPHGAVFKLN